MLDLTLFSYTHLINVLLVMCRIGSGLMLFPGIGEAYVPQRIKLILALFISLVIHLALPQISINPKISFLEAIVVLSHEIIIGVFLGVIARILINTISTSGSIIAAQTGLSSAVLFDPNQGSQTVLIANLLGVLAVLVVLETGLHHIFIQGLAQSYDLFPLYGKIPTDKMTEMVANIVSGSFEVALKIAAPQIVISLVFFLGGGILARLMPAMQIFFIMMPAQIVLGFFILMATLSGMMHFFLSYFEDMLAILF